MAMAKKRKKKRQENDYQENDYYDVLKQKVPVAVHELIRMIHRINPTGENLSPTKSAERYRVKTQLQSLLIRRFPESLIVEQPEPENPRLVGFRLRHFDQDACHAMIDELDEDARAWTQKQIDESLTGHPFESVGPAKKSVQHDSTGPADHSTRNGIKKSEEGLSRDELMARGQNALAEYDYEACEKCYRRALEVSGDDPDPAILLLELYVDYLAAYEKAVDLSQTIPMSVKNNENVKVLSALAAARSGRIDSALEHIKRSSHPRSSEVYVILVRHFIQVGEAERASILLSKLASLEQAELKFEIEQLAKNIQSLRAKGLEPLEQEMHLAQQEGRTEDSLKLADRILSVSPENRAARRLRHDIDKQQRDENINQLLSLADEAKRINDFSREAELLNKAIAGGANAQNLAKRLDYALNEARRHKEEMEIRSLINLLTQGDKRKAFLQYINLNAQQRRRINDTIHDPHWAWLEQVLSTQTATKPEKLVEAVLVLGRSKEALQEEKEPERIMAEMEPYGKVLQSVPEAHDLLHQAERLLQAVKSKEAKDFLVKAACFIEKEDPQKARACMNQIKVSLLQGDDKKLFDDIHQRLYYLEKFMRLRQKYRDSHDRGAHFAARDIAGELARHTGQDTSGYWFDRLEEQTSHINKEWALVLIDIDELPSYYASSGLQWLDETTHGCLLSDERHLIIASSHERWVFLRIFCLDDQRFKKAIILRTPRQMLLHHIYPMGNTLWITGEEGDVLELGLEPLNILSWYGFSSFIGEEEVIEGAWIFPKSKSLWLYKRHKKSDLFEIYEVIDIDQQRVVRQVKSFGYPMAINTGGHFRVGVQNTNTKTVQLYSERGKAVESFAFESYQTIHEATIHPNRNDFVFLPFDDHGTMNPFQEIDGEEEGDLVLTIEVRPGSQGKYQPLRIENSSGESPHSIFTSLDTGITFILYNRNAFSEDSEHILSAFKESGQGFEQLYEVRVPEKVVFARDEFSRRVTAMNFQGNRVQAVVLNENPPVFDFGIHGPYKKAMPEFRSDFYLCHHPRGPIKAKALADMLQIKSWSEKDLNNAINIMKQPGSNTPDEIAAFIYALERSYLFEKANDLKIWMRTQHSNHFSVLLDLAEEAGQEKKWPQVISLLEGISRPDLDDGTARHLCHLLGIGYFIQGEIQRAQNIWREGITYEEGRCDLSPYIEYARLSLMPAEERLKQTSDMAEALNIFEPVNHHLANKRWCEAKETIEKNEASSKSDLQLLARLTWAYLNQNLIPGEMPWLFKIIALGNYCQVYDNKFIYDSKVLPPCIESWPESRLSDIARQAKQWLDDL